MNNNKAHDVSDWSLPQTDSGSICMSLVHEALRVAKQQNIDISSILQQVPISDAALNAVGARVNIAQYAKLWVLLADQMNDEFFGMDARPLRRGSYQLLSKWLQHAKTLEDAIVDALKFFNLCFDDLFATLSIEDHVAYIEIIDRAELKPMFSYATYFMLVHTLICWLSGQRIALIKMQVKNAQPMAHTDYQTRFCSHIDYHSAHTRLYFSADYLAFSIKQDANTWYQFLQGTPDNLLVRFKNPNALSRQIRQLLLQQHPSHWLELPQLAQHLNMSQATIQRRLKREGLNYQQLKNEIRRDLAIQWLSVNTYSMQEISERLNFHDPSAFHRAFKKWTGISPGAYRQQQLL